MTTIWRKELKHANKVNSSDEWTNTKNCESCSLSCVKHKRTSSRRFCHRPQGLSSKTSLSSSDSSPLSRADLSS